MSMIATLLLVACIGAALTVALWALMRWTGEEAPLGHIAAVMWLPIWLWPEDIKQRLLGRQACHADANVDCSLPGVVQGLMFRGDPSPPGEAKRLTALYGDPRENLAKLHATPCRVRFNFTMPAQPDLRTRQQLAAELQRPRNRGPK